MMRTLKIMVVLMGCVAVMGCSAPRSLAYMVPQYITKVVVPKGVQPPMQKPLYAIPSHPVKGRVGALSLLPPGSRIAQYQAKK